MLHSALLVPYHSWRISHGKHHNNTGSCENDEVFAPPVKEDLVDEILLHSPLFNLFQVRFFAVGVGGWMERDGWRWMGLPGMYVSLC